jgi:hypothetical protein
MISESYRRFVNGLRTRNGLPALYPASGAAKPKPDDIVDASEGDDGGDNDGLELKDADEALELMRKTIRDINGDMDQPGDDNDDDGRDRDDKGRFAKVDEMTQLGALALPARRLMIAHFQAKLAEAPVDEKKRAKEIAEAVALMRQAGRRHFR